MHSVTSLRQNPHGRRFAIATYRCPVQAGNQMFQFTNHTLLWQYMTPKLCATAHPNITCQGEYNASECDATLERASWIPSYEE
jgi:hypothetical protein